MGGGLVPGVGVRARGTGRGGQTPQNLGGMPKVRKVAPFAPFVAKCRKGKFCAGMA